MGYGVGLRGFVIALALLATSAQAQSVSVPPGVVAAAFGTADCSIDSKDAAAGGQAPSLTGDLRLVEFYCWRAAYQAGSIFFAVDPAAPDKARLLQFPIWTDKGIQPSYSLTTPSYNAATRTMRMTQKGRGVGDCGDIGEWRWKGSAFELLRFWSKPNCDGKPFAERRRWQVYPSRGR